MSSQLKRLNFANPVNRWVRLRQVAIRIFSSLISNSQTLNGWIPSSLNVVNLAVSFRIANSLATKRPATSNLDARRQVIHSNPAIRVRAIRIQAGNNNPVIRRRLINRHISSLRHPCSRGQFIP